MKFTQEIDELWKKVNFFYSLEGILISLAFTITFALFLNYLSLLNNIYIISLLPLPTYLFYILSRKKPNLDRIIISSDRRLSLEERLITAWEYREYREPYGLVENLINDLEKKLTEKSLKDTYIWRPSKFLKILSIIMAFLIILNIARTISPLQKKPELSEKQKIEEESPSDLKRELRDLQSKLEISKKITGEKMAEENKDKLSAEKEKDKNLEKLLSEWDFEKEKLLEEVLQQKTSSPSNKNQPSSKPEEKSVPSNEASSPYMEQKNIAPNELLQREVNPENNSPNDKYELEEKIANLKEMGKENKIGENIDINSPSQEPKKDMESQGSLPGTAEREKMLGSKPTPRLNVEPEKVYVPSQGMDESKKKVYLFSAPSLKENKEKSSFPISSPLPEYKNEAPTSPRVIPQELQEVIKSYFSQ